MRALRRPAGRVRRSLMVAAALLGIAAATTVPTVGAAAAGTAAVAVPPTTTSCASNGSGGTTCTGTYYGDHAFDWQNDPAPTSPPPADPTQYWYSAAPTVTVSQTQNLGNQVVHVSWANFTPSLLVGGTTPSNQYQANVTEYAVGVFECVANPQLPPIQGTYPGGGANNSDCYAVQAQVNARAGQANAVYTYTNANGTGQADIQVETALENSALGCSSTRPCSLAIVPNWGGLQQPSFDTLSPANCEDHSQDTYANPFSEQEDVDTYIGYYCSWRDRIVVPLTFAPTPTQACSAKSYQFYAEGSPMLERAMKKWLPGWCLSSSSQLEFSYDSGVNEASARQDFLAGSSALTASTDVAMVTLPANSGQTSLSTRKFTYAPLAVSGIAISYYIDDPQTGLPITNLKLNARLVAKLITQSYSLQYGGCALEGTKPVQSPDCDPAVRSGGHGNPATIFDDPEFLALNAPYTRADFPQDSAGSRADFGAFLPTVVEGNSDLVYELTRWIMSDPSAAAFMAGNPDPWGMRVNSYYKNETMPTELLTQLDPGYSPTLQQALQNSTKWGAPWDASMQVSWNPVSSLDLVATTLVGDTSTAFDPRLTCLLADPSACNATSNAGWGLAKLQKENVGQRNLFAIVDQGNAAAFRFPTAQLVNADGVAVGPTLTSMSAAVSHMKTNPDGVTQYADFSNGDPNSYPLTMVNYAMVPTCGLTSAKAGAISHFLTNVATTAQNYGPGLGELNADGGYLALDASQVAQTKAAAADVSTQSCTSPPPDTTVNGGAPNGSSGAPGGTTPPNSGTPTGTTPTTGPGATAGHTTPGGTKSNIPTEPVALGTKSPDGGLMGLLLPIMLIVGGFVVVGGPAAYMFGTTAQGAAFYRRLRQYPGRLVRLVRR